MPGRGGSRSLIRAQGKTQAAGNTSVSGPSQRPPWTRQGQEAVPQKKPHEKSELVDQRESTPWARQGHRSCGTVDAI